MTTPKVKTTYDRGGARFYVDPETKERVPGVTSILQTLPKPWMQPWAAKRVARAAVDQHHLVKLMLESGDIEGAVDYLKGEPRRYTKIASERGDKAHKAFETLSTGGQLDPAALDAATDGYARQFTEVLDVLRPEILLTEAVVWSERYGYAGSLDALWQLEGETVVVDYKTSARIYPEVSLQLSAYAHADYMIDKVGQRYDLPKITRGVAIHFTPESWGVYEVPIGDEVFDVFRALIQVFQWTKAADRIIGQPLIASGTEG